MGSGHSHGVTAAGRNKKNLVVVLALTSTYMIAEVIGGILTGSLALLADAGHMLTDVGGLALALFAMKMAERPASPERTYGYYRSEILASVANAVVLIALSIYILYEAYVRFQSPPEIKSNAMLVVASVGLVVNLIGVRLLQSSAKESLNMKGAYFEVVSDLLTSVAVIIAGILITFTQWFWLDPILSAGIGLFILPRTWQLLKEGVGVLLEGTPSNISLVAVREEILKTDGVTDTHDLHVWSLTSGVNAMSVHVVISNGAKYSDVIKRVQDAMLSKFSISHATIQPEPSGFVEPSCHE